MKRPNAPVNWQQRAQHVDVQLNAELGAGQVLGWSILKLRYLHWH